MTTTTRYRSQCSASAHVLWTMKLVALFVIPCALLAASGALIAKHLAPAEVRLYAPDDE